MYLISLLASLFVALTIVPMVASLIFKANNKNNAEQKKPKTKQFVKIRSLYQGLLLKALKRRILVLGGALGLFLLSFVLIPFLGTEFMPAMDRDMIVLTIKMPVGTSLDETKRVVQMVEKIFVEQPEVKTISVQAGSQGEVSPADLAGGISTTGPHEGLIWAGLTSQDERSISDLEVLEKIRAKLPKLKGVKFEAVDIGQVMMGGAQAPVEIKIFGKEIPVLKEVADTIVARIQDVEGLRDITHSLSEAQPEYHIKISREEASRMGLMVSQVANTIQTASLGTVATRYREGNEEVDVRVRFKEKFRDSLEDIKNIPIMTPLNQTVRLNQVATITAGEGPIRITRENQAREVTVLANIAGRDLGSVVSDIKQRIDDVEKGLPIGYFVEFGGQYEDMQEAMLIMAGAFALVTEELMPNEQSGAERASRVAGGGLDKDFLEARLEEIDKNGKL